MSVAVLIAENLGWIRAAALRYCRDHADAADLASETIVKCLDNARRYDRRKAIRPWILTIMANTFKSALRRGKIVPMCGYENCETMGGGIDTDSHALTAEILAIVDKAEKGSVCVETFRMFLQGYNYAEIARLKGIPVGTVKSRILFGKKLLRQAVASALDLNVIKC